MLSNLPKVIALVSGKVGIKAWLPKGCYLPPQKDVCCRKLRFCHTGGYALNMDYGDREDNFLLGKILVSYKRLILKKITKLRMHKLLKKLNQIFEQNLC